MVGWLVANVTLPSIYRRLTVCWSCAMSMPDEIRNLCSDGYADAGFK